ncbi:MAG TPA: response regulator [Roseiarcus sp.]|nr:response regulator [Roseiarcus sp.]
MSEYGKLRVLIVEDELLIAMELESCLALLGQEVIGIAAESGEALELARTASPDLAVVDLHLRDGCTGPQIAADLVHRHKVLVVFSTGTPHHIPSDYAGALAAITKPWSPEAVEHVVRFVHAYRAGDRDAMAAPLLPGISIAPSLRETLL